MKKIFLSALITIFFILTSGYNDKFHKISDNHSSGRNKPAKTHIRKQRDLIKLDQTKNLPNITTKLNTLNASHEVLSTYLIGVGIIGPVGPGPLGKNPRVVETHFSERKPPKNLSVAFDDAQHTMEISWEHSCSLSSNRYPNYIITIREVVLNKTAHVKVESKTNETLRHTFHDIPRGAKYEISVATDVKDSIKANITVASMPLTAPRLMSFYPEKNGSYVVTWRKVKDMGNEKLTYQAVVRPGAGTIEEKTKEPIIILEADQPPILLHPSHLGGILSAGQVFNIGMRIKTKEGLYSEIGNMEIFEAL